MVTIFSDARGTVCVIYSIYGDLVSGTFITAAIMYLKVKAHNVVNRVVHNIVSKEVLDRIA
jgi:hypothetical protein